jgi:hypothetical protein
MNIKRQLKRGTMIFLSSNKGTQFICRKTSSVTKSEQMIFNKLDGKFYLPVKQIN